jgi:RNA polymerase sigma-70 factor (ECF subfamily)
MTTTHPTNLASRRAAASDDDAKDDLELARRAADGDELAFSTLYRRHHQRVYRHCKRLLGSPEDAADAAQQAFINLHRSFAQGSCPDTNVPAYILQVARRASYQLHHRRAAQVRAQEASRQYAGNGGSVADHAPDVIVSHTVRAAALAIPERHRAVLVMREVRDMSYEEIAESLDMNENAVAQLLHRARKRLAGELAA